MIGLPPTVGFFGKYQLIAACWDRGFNWLIVCMVLNSVVSLFYYVRVAKHLFLKRRY